MFLSCLLNRLEIIYPPQTLRFGLNTMSFNRMRRKTQNKLLLYYYRHRRNILKRCIIMVFKALALWADAFYKLKCPSLCPSVCPSVPLFTFEVPFNGLFAPTSRSRMSNIFRDSEPLGKNNVKKWSNLWIFLFGSGVKLPHNFFVFFAFCLTKHGGNHASRWIRDLWLKGVSLILAYL